MLKYIKHLLFLYKTKKKKNFLQKFNVIIHKGASFADVKFEGNNTLFKNVKLFNSSLGIGTYIGKSSEIIYAKIGKYCSIADNVHIGLGTHPTSIFVTTHPSFYHDTYKTLGFGFTKTESFNPYKWIEKDKFLVKVGNDVWIGCNAIIMDGVTIGDGAIIAAGSVVTKNVEPYSIVGGVPAKHIKYRFNQQQIDQLLKIQWWNSDQLWIINNAHSFKDINLFLKNYKNNKL